MYPNYQDNQHILRYYYIQPIGIVRLSVHNLRKQFQNISIFSLSISSYYFMDIPRLYYKYATPINELKLSILNYEC